jgi:Domain of unknown function (DUF5665)
MEKTVTEKQQIKKLPTKKEQIIEHRTQKEIERIEGLIDAIEASGLDEFMEYIRSPWKMFWPNFIAGAVRWFGAIVWASIVIALIGWTLSMIIDLPLIGKRLEPYVEKVQHEFVKYTEATNYKPNFERIEATLADIKEELKKKP